jgi:hypothetical protein
MEMATSERLAQLLQSSGLFELAAKARIGFYDDFKSPMVTPRAHLVKDLEAASRRDLAERARKGEFDCSKEEAEEWFERRGMTR